MTSKFDYPDPGTDPEYCDALSDTPPEPDRCIWCGQLCDRDDDHLPYCSVYCATLASMADDPTIFKELTEELDRADQLISELVREVANLTARCQAAEEALILLKKEKTVWLMPGNGSPKKKD